MRVYIDMVADLFHRGHVEFIKKAKSIVDNVYLIVGIHSDSVCISYKRKPIFTMQDRIIIVESCKYVDKVISNAPLIITPEFINLNLIDLVVHGNDMTEFHKTKCYYILEIHKQL